MMGVPFTWLTPYVPEGGWSTAIWAGPGYGDNRGDLQAQGARQIVYLEPESDLADLLETSLRRESGGSLLRMAVWNSRGEQALYRVNDPLQSSLLHPDQLLASRRNLRVESVAQVATTTLDVLCEPLESDDQRLLVLDVNGAEQCVLQGASDATLRGFACVLVHFDPAHASAETARAVVASRLSSVGFDPSTDADDTVEWLLYLRQPSSRGRQDLPEVLELRAALAAARAEAEEFRSHSTEERREAEQHIAALQNELDQARGLQQRVVQLEGELAQVQSQAERMAHLERELEHERGLTQRVGQLESELAQAHKSVRMSVKLQSQREADLQELQERYHRGQEELERQRQLLDKLAERLGVASRYFHQLSAQSPDDVASREVGQRGPVQAAHSPKPRASSSGGKKPRPATKSKSKA